MSTNFHGVWVDALVPLQEDLSIDQVKLTTHVRNLSVKGIENFVLFGQAGEGASFAADEKLVTVAHLLAAGLEPSNILFGVQSSSFVEISLLIRKAYDKGIRRFLVSPPQYGQPLGHIALFDYFNQLIQHVNHSDWQLFIHQLGGTNQSANLPEATIADLKKSHPVTFVGIVVQDIHVNHAVDLSRSFGNDLAIAPCYEPNLTILKSTVCVSVLANILPSTVKHLLANDFVNNATKIAGMKVAKPDDRVVELLTVLSEYPLVAALKLMLSMHYRMDGWSRVRPPQSELTKEARDKLMAAFKKFNLQGNE